MNVGTDPVVLDELVVRFRSKANLCMFVRPDPPLLHDPKPRSDPQPLAKYRLPHSHNRRFEPQTLFVL